MEEKEREEREGKSRGRRRRMKKPEQERMRCMIPGFFLLFLDFFLVLKKNTTKN